MDDSSELTAISNEAQQIVARRPFSGVALVFFLIAAGFVGLAFLPNEANTQKTFFILAVFPLMLALAYWLTRGKEFHAELLPDALRINAPVAFDLPFSEIQALQREGGGKSKHFPIHIFHEHGVISIPRHVQPSSEELLKVLASKIPLSVANELPDQLLAIYQKHVNTFGAARVFAFPARQRKIKGVRGIRGMAISAACFLTGIVWVLPIIETKPKGDPSVLFGLGACFIFYGFLAFVYCNAQRRLYGGAPKWKYSGIVVSPVGLAMIQDKERGEMKWSELVKLKYSPKRPFFLTTSSTNSPTHIRLVMSGGVLAVLDIYSHPLSIIYEKMKQFWGK